jgi:hypothetical protein
MRVQVEGHYGPTPASWPRSSLGTSSHQTVVAEDQPTTRLLHQNQWTRPNPSIQDQTEHHQKVSIYKT